MKKTDLFWFACLASASQLSFFPASVLAEQQQLVRTFGSICDAYSADAIEIGEVLQLRAQYVTDGVHTSFITSGTCGRNSVLPVENLPSTYTRSAKEFFGRIEKSCADDDVDYFCNRKIEVISIVRIVAGPEGDRPGAEMLVVLEVPAASE